MIVDPYKRPPKPPLVAVIDPAGVIHDERGRHLDLDSLPPQTRVFAAWDTARALIGEGRGEALTWNGQEIRWRHRSFEDDWKPRTSDVPVIRLPGDEIVPTENLLHGLVEWRDWLDRYGASPTGTMGSAAWSLLRATIAERIWCSTGDRPPLSMTLGGRQELGERGRGRFEGRLSHLDLPAAYASTLGGLSYGGRWFTASSLPVDHPAEWWAASGRAVFVRARVRVPELPWGPLPQRPRKRVRGLAAALLGASYPTGRRLQGVWTWQELEAAELYGTQILEVLEAWVHIGGTPVFAPWWEAVQDGRSTAGLGGRLAKMTGNALWGRFCMDSRGERRIRSKVGKRTVERRLPVRPGPLPAHDLAETVSGRVRAKLWTLMMLEGSRLLTAHTDGAWIDGHPGVLEDEWRVSEQARRLDLLDPQILRYWPSAKADPRVVYSGVPPGEAEQAFERAWDEAGLVT